MTTAPEHTDSTTEPARDSATDQTTRSSSDSIPATEREPIDVLFVQRASDSFGGGSKMLLRLLAGLDHDRFDATLLTQFEDELCRRLGDEPVAVETVPYRPPLDQYNGKVLSQPPHRKLASGLRVLQFDLEAREHLQRADVVWCDCLRSLLTIGPYVGVSSTPVVWNVGLGHESEGVRTYLNEAALWLADRVFIESDRQARRVFSRAQYERYREQFVVFHKGIDTDRFSPGGSEPGDGGERDEDSDGDGAERDGDGVDGERDVGECDVGECDRNGNAPVDERDRDAALRVGTAAAITPRKGLEHYVDAAAAIAAQRDDVEFAIAGDTVHDEDEAYRRSLQRRVAAAGIEDVVEFLGWVEEMPSYYESLDVFVLPSHNEGIPGAVREALSTEVPAVATDVGGTADVVIDGETGLLVPPEDAEALADAIEHLLDRPAERERMGAAGRERIVEEFSIAQYVRRYERLFADLAGGGRSDPA